MKPHYSLYIFGAILIIFDMRFAYGFSDSLSGRTSIMSDTLLGIIILTCGSILGRQHKELLRLKAIVERLRGPEVDLYSEAIQDLKNSTKETQK